MSTSPVGQGLPQLLKWHRITHTYPHSIPTTPAFTLSHLVLVIPSRNCSIFFHTQTLLAACVWALTNASFPLSKSLPSSFSYTPLPPLSPCFPFLLFHPFISFSSLFFFFLSLLWLLPASLSFLPLPFLFSLSINRESNSSRLIC